MIFLDEEYNIKIIENVDALPNTWDNFKADNLFLSIPYLKALSQSSPQNITLCFVGIFFENILVGKVLFQKINFSHLSPFKSNTKIKESIKNIIALGFATNVLIIGNNMLTGQNAFVFNEQLLPYQKGVSLLFEIQKKILEFYKQKKNDIDLCLIKDIEQKKITCFEDIIPKYKYTKCQFQPNMTFALNKNWNNTTDYLNALNTKYRTQYNRARKKGNTIIKKTFALEDIIHFEKEIYNLYQQVQNNAMFNTFNLPLNHFVTLKKTLGNYFHFYAYFKNDNIVGFNTIIENEKYFYTYFLGYDLQIQKEYHLYINMLYDMLAFGIKNNIKTIAFARTAMEIKSSIGAEAQDVYGFIKHRNRLINYFLPLLINLLEPKIDWQARQPFK